MLSFYRQEEGAFEAFVGGYRRPNLGGLMVMLELRRSGTLLSSVGEVLVW